VILDVIVNREQYFRIRFLDELTARKDVREAYEAVYRKLLKNMEEPGEYPTEWAGALIEVAIGSGRQDREELEPLVDILLSDERVNYEHYDQIARYLAARKDVTKFASRLEEAVQTMKERDNRLPALAEQLFRAGAREIPRGLLLQSRSEKRGEQYNDVKIGLKSLDRKSDHQYDVCRIERLFTGRMLLDRFRDDSIRENPKLSLWPESLELEPYPSSWKFALQSALSQMDLDAELDDFIDALAARVKPGDESAADRELFKALFRIFLENQEEKHYTRMAKAVTEDLSAIQDEEFKKLDDLRKTAEINIAWKANQDGDRKLSRELTDRLLQEGAESSHLYFLDARLAWLETDDPNKAVEIGSRYAKGMHGGSGRARLLNLIGCAQDELKNYDAALKFFQEAANQDPEQVFYFDNIAEMYDKKNEPRKAYEWAREAKRRGSRAEIVKKILKKGEPKDS